MLFRGGRYSDRECCRECGGGWSLARQRGVRGAAKWTRRYHASVLLHCWDCRRIWTNTGAARAVSRSPRRGSGAKQREIDRNGTRRRRRRAIQSHVARGVCCVTSRGGRVTGECQSSAESDPVPWWSTKNRCEERVVKAQRNPDDCFERLNPEEYLPRRIFRILLPRHKKIPQHPKCDDPGGSCSSL